MDVMTLSQLVDQTAIDPQTLVTYRDRYLLYLPVIRVGQAVGFLPEAVDVIRHIHVQTNAGLDGDAIEADLAERYPVSVIASQPIASAEAKPGAGSMAVSPVSGLLQDVDHKYQALTNELSQIREDLGKTASEERALQIQQMITGVARTTNKHLEPIASELAQIRQAVGVLAARVERQHTATLRDRTDLSSTIDTLTARLPEYQPGITDELNAVRHELAGLRSAIPAVETEVAPEMQQLAADVTSLREQIGELRRDRGHMVGLMSALQDNLAQLYIELADARQTRITPTPIESVFPMIGADVEPFDPEPIPATGTDGLRTPRRLDYPNR
jgi:predicted  nucleic acid-binding Zn-ribbon protein